MRLHRPSRPRPTHATPTSRARSASARWRTPLRRRAVPGAVPGAALVVALVVALWLLSPTPGVAAPPAAPRTTRPCVIPRVNMARVEAALARLAQRPQSRQPSRLWALLPAKLSAGGQQSVNTGAGLTIADDGSNVRWLAGDRRGWSVRLSWDLRALWATRARQRMPALAHALLVDRIATRVAAAVQAVGHARAVATEHPNGTARCFKAQADARGAELRLRALLAATRQVSSH